MTHPTPTPGSTHRLSTALLGLALPLVALGAAAALAWSWRPSLPDPVAMHWGSDGPDGFGSLAEAVGVPLLIGAALTVLLWALSWRAGAHLAARRTLVGTSVWLSVFVGALSLGTLHGQRGLTDATEAGGIGGTIALALAVSSVAAALAVLATPVGQRVSTTAPVPPGASRLPLGDDERAVWFQRPRGGAGLVVGLLAAAVSAGAAVSAQLWWMLALAAGLVALVAAMFAWVVRVDENGLSVRSALGVPRTHIPLGEVTEARATTVRCFPEFGGWGWRTAMDGRTGILLRSGEALEVTRTGGGVFLVTVDDAETAAGLLNTLADRSRQREGVE